MFLLRLILLIKNIYLCLAYGLTILRSLSGPPVNNEINSSYTEGDHPILQMLDYSPYRWYLNYHL